MGDSDQAPHDVQAPELSQTTLHWHPHISGGDPNPSGSGDSSTNQPPPDVTSFSVEPHGLVAVTDVLLSLTNPAVEAYTALKEQVEKTSPWILWASANPEDNPSVWPSGGWLPHRNPNPEMTANFTANCDNTLLQIADAIETVSALVVALNGAAQAYAETDKASVPPDLGVEALQSGDRAQQKPTQAPGDR
jgi:hypothetical protein